MSKKKLSDFESYECEGQTDIFDFINPIEGSICETCVYLQDIRAIRKPGDKPKLTCTRCDKHNPFGRFVPPDDCNKFRPAARFYKCCDSCCYGNLFCKDNCWLSDKEGEDMPNRHHREGFPNLGKDYHDNHEWDICDKFKSKFKGVELR